MNNIIFEDNKDLVFKTMTTVSGKQFDPINPDPQLIDIEDIAHALSLICRANGHLPHFYSVAQHAINCAKLAKSRNYPDKLQLICLLHDASEGYIADIIRPVKAHLQNYLDIEENLQNAIYKKYLGSIITKEEIAMLKAVDDDILIAEMSSMMNSQPFDRNPSIPDEISFSFRDFCEVKAEFLSLFKELSTI